MPDNFSSQGILVNIKFFGYLHFFPLILLQRAQNNGFEVKMKCRAYSYVKAFGKCVAGGKKGVIHGHFTYERYRTNSETRPEVIQEGDLKWGNDVHLTMPTRTEGYAVELIAFNGESVVDSGKLNNRYFKCDYNKLTNAFIIKPNSVEIALK